MQFSSEKRRSIDEMTNISFNYETTNNNTTDSTLNSLNMHNGGNSLLNQSGDNNNNNNKNGDDDDDDGDHDDDEEVLFDELAILCSGQFRAGKEILIVEIFFISNLNFNNIYNLKY